MLALQQNWHRFPINKEMYPSSHEADVLKLVINLLLWMEVIHITKLCF